MLKLQIHVVKTLVAFGLGAVPPRDTQVRDLPRLVDV
jgi:hypothetical protein